NNSLDTMQNCLHLLSGQVQARGAPVYELLLTEAARLSRLVREILGLYRSPRPSAPADFNAVVTQTLRALEPRLRKVRLITALGKLPPVAVSSAQLRTVLSNLVLNAADAMPGGGKLRVETRVGRNRRIRLRVSDTGSGIPPELRPKIFQAFVTSKGDRSTGLGLWMVAQIVSHHGGRVLALPRRGRGTIFEVELPGEVKKKGKAKRVGRMEKPRELSPEPRAKTKG
ncbi:MAG: HAMP domain-containing histidine kinase, partial [Acidobacteria bacterium]|nr:HAMP domain-containing histidine kinase [Acidobacteriota bacterium]